MARLVLIGASGYIGGDLLQRVAQKCPQISITAVVRKKEDKELLQSLYAHIDFVVSQTISGTKMTNILRDADIVVNTAPDVGFETELRSILEDMQDQKVKGRKFYVHTSGAASVWEPTEGRQGSGRVWNDIAHLPEILSLPENRVHRKTDKMVLEASNQINTAIISPATVYGVSASPRRPLPITLHMAVAIIKQHNAGFTIGDGSNRQSYVNLADLMDLYMLFILHALDDGNTRSDIWGPDAYYFVAGETMSFAEYMDTLVAAFHSHGILNSSRIIPLRVHLGAPLTSGDEETQCDGRTAFIFGSEGQVLASRAREVLGWKPQKISFEESMLEMVKVLGSDVE